MTFCPTFCLSIRRYVFVQCVKITVKKDISQVWNWWKWLHVHDVKRTWKRSFWHLMHFGHAAKTEPFQSNNGKAIGIMPFVQKDICSVAVSVQRQIIYSRNKSFITAVTAMFCFCVYFIITSRLFQSSYFHKYLNATIVGLANGVNLNLFVS